MEPRIQYATTSDGVSIAFWTMGDGEPPLILSPQLGWSHISLELRAPELVQWYEQLASRRTVVRYDPRCQGLSDRGVERLSEADLASDIAAVMERLGRPQVDLLGCFGLGPPVLRVAAQHPDEVRRLVVYNPFVIGPRQYGNERALAIRRLIDSDWDLFTNTFAHQSVGWSTRDAQRAGALAAYIRRAVSQRDAALILDALAKIDWRPWLARIRVPTLVLRGPVIDPGADVRWADIPDVRLVDLPGRGLLYESPAGHAAIEGFLGDGQEPSVDLPSGTAVVLFADIADSTALTERLGDEGFREKARDLDEALRSAIREHQGTPIEGKLLGDGVLATFGAAREAIACAGAVHEAGRHAGLPLHVGIHAGDVIREEGNVYGGAVNIAARISALSAPGDVLVSQTVRDLARTSAGVSFEDRGRRRLKGVAEPVRVFAVRQAE